MFIEQSADNLISNDVIGSNPVEAANSSLFSKCGDSFESTPPLLVDIALNRLLLSLSPAVDDISFVYCILTTNKVFV